MRRCVLALTIVVDTFAVCSAQEDIAAACEQLVVENVRARDASDVERWINSFTEDAELLFPVIAKGHDALRKRAESWSKDVAFQITSIDIQAIDATTATGRSYVTMSWPSASGGRDGQSIAPGSALFLYVDDFELAGDGCKIVRREEIAVFQRASSERVDDI